MTMPKVFEEAIAEFEEQKDNFEDILDSDLDNVTGEFENLKITELTRQTPVN